MSFSSQSEERYLSIIEQSRPILTNAQWMASILVLRGGHVDPAIWPRPGEYIATKLLMSDQQPILDRLGIDNEFLGRLSSLSPAEGWAVIQVGENYWIVNPIVGSIEAYLRAEGIWQ